MGDFNNLASTLSKWASINGLYSLSSDLSNSKPGHPFATFNGTSTVKPSHIDHIFLQQDTMFHLNFIGGLMHPILSLVTDHNPSLVGLVWPETPHQFILLPPLLESSTPRISLQMMRSVVSLLTTWMPKSRPPSRSHHPSLSRNGT